MENKKNFDNIIDEQALKIAKEHLQRGLLRGAKAVAGAVLAMIDSSQKNDTVVEDIRKFCERSLGLKEPKND